MSGLLAVEDLLAVLETNSNVEGAVTFRNRWLSLFTVGIIYLLVRMHLCDWQLGPKMDVWENPTAFASQPTRALSIANIHAKYAWLALWPR